MGSSYESGKTIHTAQNMKFSIKDVFSKFTKEILNGKLHFLCSVIELRPIDDLEIGLRSKISVILGRNVYESVEGKAY